jgi:hypothetical protein
MVRAVARHASIGLKWNVLRECTENVSTATRTADVANGRNNLGVRERRNLSQKVMAMKANGTTVKATMRSTGVYLQTNNKHDENRKANAKRCSFLGGAHATQSEI